MRPPIDIEFALKGIVGTASPVLGVITSFQEQIEWHLRIASLLVGLLVGVLSLIAMIRKLRRKPDTLTRSPGRESAQIPQLRRQARRLRAALNAIPFVDPRLGVFIFAAASILKDAVNRIGDLLDDGKANSSFKA